MTSGCVATRAISIIQCLEMFVSEPSGSTGGDHLIAGFELKKPLTSHARARARERAPVKGANILYLMGISILQGHSYGLFTGSKPKCDFEEHRIQNL